MDVSWADNSAKKKKNNKISNPEPDLYNNFAHTKFGDDPLIFTGYCPETKILTCRGQINLSKIDEICPLAIPNQISTISMHIPSLVI